MSRSTTIGGSIPHPNLFVPGVSPRDLLHHRQFHCFITCFFFFCYLISVSKSTVCFSNVNIKKTTECWWLWFPVLWWVVHDLVYRFVTRMWKSVPIRNRTLTMMMMMMKMVMLYEERLEEDWDLAGDNRDGKSDDGSDVSQLLRGDANVSMLLFCLSNNFKLTFWVNHRLS